MGEDSKKLKYGSWDDLTWIALFSRLWDWRTVILQLSGFYCK